MLQLVGGSRGLSPQAFRVLLSAAPSLLWSSQAGPEPRVTLVPPSVTILAPLLKVLFAARHLLALCDEGVLQTIFLWDCCLLLYTV